MVSYHTVNTEAIPYQEQPANRGNQYTLQSNTTYIVNQMRRLHVSVELTNPSSVFLYKTKSKEM